MDEIKKHITEYHRPKRKAISSTFPILVKPATLTKRIMRGIKNTYALPRLKKQSPFTHVLARHSSPLYRKLGTSDMQLQINKVTNIRIAIAHLDGLVIQPGEIFSFWHAIGAPTADKGYVEGMLLSNGNVVTGIGGGLCQLSNFLMWIFLHADIEIIERHHHSVDAFPDSGRTLPFGSGATVFNNYVDLQIKNTGAYPVQLKLWLTDTMLKGQLLSPVPATHKYHLNEHNHCFIEHNNLYFRYNEIHRTQHVHGQLVRAEKIFTNFAPVRYDVDATRLKEMGYGVISMNTEEV